MLRHLNIQIYKLFHYPIWAVVSNLENMWSNSYRLIKISHCVKSVQTWCFFWAVIFSIRTEYGEIRRISPYSVRMREYTDEKKLRICTLFTQCIKHLFSIDCVNIYLFSIYFSKNFARWKKLSLIGGVNTVFVFSQYFFNRFCPVEKCRVTPYCLYRD